MKREPTLGRGGKHAIEYDDVRMEVQVPKRCRKVTAR
jgi:hypothetical protein